jgi:hypothetical protein
VSYVFRTYACDGGGTMEEHTFELMQERSEGPPRYCPRCGRVVARSAPRPAKIAIGGAAITKSVDSTYRLLEDTSAQRAAAANNPQLKITNMKDHLREGDSAAFMPVNDVTRFMAKAGESGVHYGWGGFGNMISPVTTTPSPINYNTWSGPAHSTLSMIQGEGGTTHRDTRLQAQIRGQQNKVDTK